MVVDNGSTDRSAAIAASCGAVVVSEPRRGYGRALRTGLSRPALERLELHTDGMEFATELIAEAARKGLRIGEAPVPLRKSRYARKPKLRTFRDGFRHLRYILKS